MMDVWLNAFCKAPIAKLAALTKLNDENVSWH